MYIKMTKQCGCCNDILEVPDDFETTVWKNLEWSTCASIEDVNGNIHEDLDVYHGYIEVNID